VGDTWSGGGRVCGTAWRCVHRQTGVEVACKQVEKRGVSLHGCKERLRRCFSQARRPPQCARPLGGPRRVTESSYIVTELCEGDLFDYVSGVMAADQQMPEAHAREGLPPAGTGGAPLPRPGVPAQRPQARRTSFFTTAPKQGGLGQAGGLRALRLRLEQGGKAIGWVGSEPWAKLPRCSPRVPMTFRRMCFPFRGGTIWSATGHLAHVHSHAALWR